MSYHFMHRFLQSFLGKYYFVFLDMSYIVSLWFVSDMVISILNHSFLLAIMLLYCMSSFAILKEKTNAKYSFCKHFYLYPIITA